MKHQMNRTKLVCGHEFLWYFGSPRSQMQIWCEGCHAYSWTPVGARSRAYVPRKKKEQPEE